MKHFFINFLLSIFFILPNWALKVLTLRKEITYKNEVFDYQSMIYISLISWFITKFGYVLDMSEFSDDMRKKMANLRIKINNNVALKKIIQKEEEDNSQNKVKENLKSIAKSKIGRNEPCPCNSGKKYKHCCGSL